MRIIGVTGPSGAGKSLLCSELEKKNIPTIDADGVYHSLLIPPSPCLDAIRREFGNAVFHEDGSLDRAALGAIVFADEKMLSLLNSTVLSFVIEKIRAIISDLSNKGFFAVVVDAPTLIESGFSEECDTVISVTAPKEMRIARIIERDSIDREAAERRVNAQKSDDFYRLHSDIVIDNRDDKECFERKISQIADELVCTDPKKKEKLC